MGEMTCAGCQTLLDDNHPSGSACPKCVEVRRNYAARAEPAVIRVTARDATFRLTPIQTRDLKVRWGEVEREAQELLNPIAGSPSGEDIKERRTRVLQFFVHLWSLKDHAVACLLPPDKDIFENTITTTPILALTADLGNLEKHGSLNRLRSGTQPSFGPVSGSTTKTGTWILELEVVHGARRLNVLDVIRDGLAAWEALLARMKLL